MAELRSVLGFTRQALQVAHFGQIETLLADLAAVVGADTATLTHLDLRTQREVVVFWPPSRADRAYLNRYVSVAHTHPLRRPLAVQARRGPSAYSAIRTSDVLSRQEWRASALHREALRDVDDQMSLLLSATGSSMHAVTLARFSGVFSDRQRELLDGCGAHLAHAVANAPRDDHRALQIAPSAQWVPAGDVPGLSVDGGVDQRVARLSPREQEVLRLVADGLTDVQIGRRLGLATATVSKHLRRVYLRSGVPNRAAAVGLLRGAKGPAAGTAGP